MTERIFLTYTNATAVPYQGTTLGHHAVLNYIDADGRLHTLQGMPENKFEHNFPKLRAFIKEEVGSGGASNRDSPFGTLRAHLDDRKDDVDVSRQPYTTVIEGNDLKRQWDATLKFGDHVNATGYEYRPDRRGSSIRP